MTDRLRELLAKATPRPWKKSGDGAEETYLYSDEWNDTGPVLAVLRADLDKRIENAALIIAAVNALPALLDVVEKAEELAKAVDAHELVCDRPRPIADALRTALDALNGGEG